MRLRAAVWPPLLYTFMEYYKIPGNSQFLKEEENVKQSCY